MEECRAIIGPSPSSMTGEQLISFVYEELGRESQRLIQFAPVAKERATVVRKEKKSSGDQELLKKIMAYSAAYVAKKEKGEEID